MMTMEKKRILVVENDACLCYGIQEILEMEGYLPLATEDANAAMQVFNDFFPELIILGFGSRPMPAQLRLIDAYQGLYPIIYVCYHYAARDLLRESWGISRDMILTKPFDIDELLRMIVHVIRMHDIVKNW